MTIVIIGGGPTWSRIGGFVRRVDHTVLTRDFSRIDPSKARILLIEGAPAILSYCQPI